MQVQDQSVEDAGWTKDRLSSWLAESDEAQGLVLFTNASGIDKQSTLKAAKKDFTLITVGDLLSLSPETIENIRPACSRQGSEEGRSGSSRIRTSGAPSDDVVKGFKKHDRGQLILPCGAGKTLTALWLKERLGAKRTLVLVPSLALLRQIRSEWAAQQKERLPYLCVCSEKDIDKDKRDAIVTHTFEVPGHVTTRPDEIAAFARKHRELVVYSTYQSLQAVVDAGVKFDLAICDEAHKTATARHNEFALVHNEELKVRKRLYMTATPRVLSYQAKAKLGDDPFKTVADMSDEETFGPEFHRMGFGEAIDEGILSDYKIVVVGVNDKQVHKHIEERAYLEDASADQVATSLALQKAMKKHGAAHALTFHSNIKRAKAFKDIHDRRVRRTKVEHVNGSMSTNDRLVLLDEFRVAPHAVLTNARCLTEGVDVPAIDSVAFVDPRHSKVDIVQAAGRALRIGDGTKAYGVILIPLFYRVGEDPEEIASSGVFKNVFEVVRAMADHDTRLQAEITSLRLGEGKRGSDSSRVIVDANDEEERLVFEGFEQRLQAALLERVVERSVSKTVAMLTGLRMYKEGHGHTDVPREEGELGAWIHRIREEKRAGRSFRFEPELERLGFSWLVPGETLTDTTGLLSEPEFAEASGFSPAALHNWRKQGRLVPHGHAVTTHGLGPFYRPAQIEELRRSLGITLKSTEGLLPEVEIRTMLGFSSFRHHADKCGIDPVGYALTGKHVTPYYSPQQVDQLKKHLGVTLQSTEGLLTARQFIEATGFRELRKYVKRGLIEPVGYALGGKPVTAYFSLEQVPQLELALGITLHDTEGLLSETELAKASGAHLVRLGTLRRRGVLVPAGFAMGSSGVAPFYRPEQAQEVAAHLRGPNFSDEKVLAIYNDPRTAKEIAEDHQVSTASVYMIKSGTSWAHVTGHKAGGKK